MKSAEQKDSFWVSEQYTVLLSLFHFIQPRPRSFKLLENPKVKQLASWFTYCMNKSLRYCSRKRGKKKQQSSSATTRRTFQTHNVFLFYHNHGFAWFIQSVSHGANKWRHKVRPLLTYINSRSNGLRQVSRQGQVLSPHLTCFLLLNWCEFMKCFTYSPPPTLTCRSGICLCSIHDVWLFPNTRRKSLISKRTLKEHKPAWEYHTQPVRERAYEK